LPKGDPKTLMGEGSVGTGVDRKPLACIEKLDEQAGLTAGEPRCEIRPEPAGPVVAHGVPQAPTVGKPRDARVARRVRRQDHFRQRRCRADPVLGPRRCRGHPAEAVDVLAAGDLTLGTGFAARVEAGMIAGLSDRVLSCWRNTQVRR
jgi:hypothetical protein